VVTAVGGAGVDFSIFNDDDSVYIRCPKKQGKKAGVKKFLCVNHYITNPASPSSPGARVC